MGHPTRAAAAQHQTDAGLLRRGCREGRDAGQAEDHQQRKDEQRMG